MGELLQGVDARRIESGHIPKTQNHHIPKCVQILRGVRQFFCSPEEKRTVDAEDGHVRGNVLVLQDVRLPILQVFGG